MKAVDHATLLITRAGRLMAIAHELPNLFHRRELSDITRVMLDAAGDLIDEMVGRDGSAESGFLDRLKPRLREVWYERDRDQRIFAEDVEHALREASR